MVVAMAKDGKQGVLALEGQTQVFKTMLSYVDSMVLRCAIELGIPDIIHEHGKGEPLSLSRLISLLPSSPSPSAVLRIMRFLSYNDIFSQTTISGEPHFGLTHLSNALLSSSDLNISAVALLVTHPFLQSAWPKFSSSLKSGEAPYKLAQGMDMLFETAAINPEFNDVFNNAMACTAKGTIDAVMSRYDDGFKGLGSIVDVGGSTGATVAEIVRLNPGIKGINFDIPHVVKGAPEYPGVTHVAGDMWETVPQADAVFMKTVMHCFGDELCLKALKNCRSAIPEKTGKVIIMDVVLYSDDDSTLGNIRAKYDMLMYAHTVTGLERTEEEWKKLLNSAGFPRVNFIKIPAVWSIIEAFPV